MEKTVVMFPGQASQYVGMGKKWFEKFDSVKERFDQASDVLGWDLAKLCFYGDSNILTKTENAQVAIVALSVAMYDVIVKEYGVVPSYLAGHSIGEISALTASGVFNFKDAIKIARVRGEAMAECNVDHSGGMAAVVGIEVDDVKHILSDINLDKSHVMIANYNTPLQTILSGNLQGIDIVRKQIEAHNGRVIPLNVSGPFHSIYMKPAQDKLRNLLESISIGAMEIPVMCCHTGKLYTHVGNIITSLVDQLVSPVRWTDVVNELYINGAGRWLEVGSKDVLKKLVQTILPKAMAYSYDDHEMEISSEKVEQINPVGLCLGAAVSTQNRNWNEDEYRKGVIEPYKEIQKLYRVMEEEERQPSETELTRCLELLKTIFITKGVSQEECRQRYKKILKNTDYIKTIGLYIEGEDMNGYSPS